MAPNRIVDTFADAHQIMIRGLRIIYTVDGKVGRLGIFVSSSIAGKEHAEVTSTMKTIEALAPGLDEMMIDGAIGEDLDTRCRVSCEERKLSEIETIDEDRTERL